MLYIELAAGILLLLVGGELLVRGAVGIARRLRVSPLVIGLTLVGFGTSTPELVTSVQAALAGSPGIAVGNVVGSNICNILLILGLAAVIRPIAVDGPSFRRDGAVLAGVTLACLAILLLESTTRLIGAALVTALLVYLGWLYRSTRGNTADHSEDLDGAAEPRVWVCLLQTLAGLALVIYGGDLLVDGAIALAQSLGVSETVIGLTIVAVGTSLPELVTSVLAALRKQDGIAFGNIVGSNIYNVLGILGVTTLVRPVPIPPEIASFDGWIMALATIVLIIFAVTGARVSRGEGALLFGSYAGYCAWLVAGAA